MTVQDGVTSLPPAPIMEECGVCYQDYGPDSEPRPLGSCRHVLCGACLEQLESGGFVTCPFCRARSQVPGAEGAAGDVTRRKGPLRWLKRLCGKSRAGPRRQGSLAKEDIRDLALMSSYFF